MTLPEYIRSIGVPAFVEQFKRYKVTERAATAYMYGQRRPRPELAEQIVRKTPVTWPGIYISSDRH